jgi:uncharacterized LabA/DUF88 family protein
MPNFGKKAIFIDGSNLHYSAKALGFDIDFKRLLTAFDADGRLLRAYYYTTIIHGSEFHSIRPLIDWLDYNGYAVTAKPAKEFDDAEGRRKIKRNCLIDLAIDAMALARKIDRMILFTGDGDIRALVEAMQRRGVHVTVVSTLRSKPAMLSDDLRRQADEFLELERLKPSICRLVQPALSHETPSSQNFGPADARIIRSRRE